MAELEQSLRACHDEVSGHINSLGEMERAHQTQIDTLRSKVDPTALVNSLCMCVLNVSV